MHKTGGQAGGKRREQRKYSFSNISFLYIYIYSHSFVYSTYARKQQLLHIHIPHLLALTIWLYVQYIHNHQYCLLLVFK